MGATDSLLLMLLLMGAAATVPAAAASPAVDEQCAADASKLTDCLGYASGGEAAPSKKCCESVSDVKQKDPSCLCLVIRQAHDDGGGGGGGGGFSGFHLRLDRLLALPSACNLPNASVAICTKLLNLPPNSAEAAIFTNSSVAKPGTPASAAMTGSPSGDAPNLMMTSCSAFLVASICLFFLNK